MFQSYMYAFLELFSTLHVFFLDLNSLGPDDGPVRTETCSPTANKVYTGHLLVVLDGYINNISIHLAIYFLVYLSASFFPNSL